MMDRRLFLKITGLVAAASALDALPVSAEVLPSSSTPRAATSDLPRWSPDAATRIVAQQLATRAPGLYQISGQVRLLEPVVEISGISNSQLISQSNVGGLGSPVVSFSTFEQLGGPGLTPNIQVRGGYLEALTVVPVDFT